jgi:hypothetical protein
MKIIIPGSSTTHRHEHRCTPCMNREHL